MQICGKHWQALREAIERYGLSGLVARNGEDAVSSIVRDFNEENTVIDFDPLMGSNFMLWNLAQQFTGMQAMFANEDGTHKCPVCELITYNWCEGAVWQSRMEAEKRGLVPVDRSDISTIDLGRTQLTDIRQMLRDAGYTQPPGKPVGIVVNGEPRDIVGDITYEQVEGWTEPGVSVVFTMPNGVAGCLSKGQKIMGIEGVRITAVVTGNA